MRLGSLGAHTEAREIPTLWESLLLRITKTVLNCVVGSPPTVTRVTEAKGECDWPRVTQAAGGRTEPIIGVVSECRLGRGSTRLAG